MLPLKLINARSVALASATHVLWRGALVAAGVLVSRGRTTGEFAHFQFLNTTALALASYASLGLAPAASRFLASRDGTVAEERRPHAYLLLIGGAALAVLAAVIAAASGEVILGEVAAFRWQFAALAAVYVLSGIVDAALVGLSRLGTLFFATASGAALLLSLFFVFAGSADLANLLWLFCVPPGLTLAINLSALLVLIRPRRRDLGGVWQSRLELLAIAKFALPLFATSLIFVSVPWLFGRILQGDPEKLARFAAFSIGLQWFGLVLLLPSMVTRVVTPQIFLEADDSRLSRELLMKRTVANVVIAAITAGALGLFAPFVLRLYGVHASDAASELVLMSIGAVLASAVAMAGTYVMAAEGPWQWLKLFVWWGAGSVGIFTATFIAGAAQPALGYVVGYVLLASLAWTRILRSRATASPLNGPPPKSVTPG